MNKCEKCDLESDEYVTLGLCVKCKEEDEAISSSQSQQPGRQCPCEQGSTSLKSLMNCTSCNLWWHPQCIGLAGLTYHGTKNLTDWKCIRCFSLPKEIADKIGFPNPVQETEGSDTIKNIVREEMRARIPEVIGEIVNEVKHALGESSLKQLAQEANDTIVKNWENFAKTEQKKVISEVVEKTSEVAMVKNLGRISADLSEQKNRVRNCVLSDIPEGSGGADTSLGQVVAALAGNEFATDDIAICKRLGMKKPGQNRLTLVVFKREQVAAEFHNFGRGRKIGNTWVNPDLTSTERQARYQSRVERRQRLADMPRRPIRQAAEDTTGQEPRPLEENQQPQQPRDDPQQPAALNHV